MTLTDLEKVMSDHPDLTQHGFGVEPGKDFETERAALPKHIDACNACVEWLSLCHQTAGIRPSAGDSYSLKHNVERWYKIRYNGHLYVPTGALIAAAYFLGLKTRRTNKMDVYLNISKLPN